MADEDGFQQLPVPVGEQQDAGPVAGPVAAAALCKEVKFKKEDGGVKIRFSGREIFLARGISYYEEHKDEDDGELDGVILYGNTGEMIAIREDQVAVFYTAGSNIQFALKKPIETLSLVVESVKQIGVKDEKEGRDNPGALEQLVPLAEGEECDPTGGRKKTRLRKTKRRRTLRKHK